MEPPQELPVNEAVRAIEIAFWTQANYRKRNVTKVYFADGLVCEVLPGPQSETLLWRHADPDLRRSELYMLELIEEFAFMVVAVTLEPPAKPTKPK